MPGKARLQEIATEQVNRARDMAQRIKVTADHPGTATIAGVDECARSAHEAIDRAADAARILVREN
jgi:hypothetical protein